MTNMVNKIYNTAVVVREVLHSQEFDNALNIASKKLTALRNTEKREYSAFYNHIAQEKSLMDKYYTHQRKTICKALFAQVKAIYNDKKQERTQTTVETVYDY